MSLDRDVDAKDQEGGEVQAAVDLAVVKVGMRTRKGKIGECVHQGEEVEVVVIAIEGGGPIQDQNQGRSPNLIALDRLEINDGLMTNTISYLS